MVARRLVVASLCAAGCASPTSPSPACPPALETASAGGSISASTSAAPAASGAAPAAPCRKRPDEASAFFDELVGRLQPPPLETGATRTEHEQLFRLVPLLHESGVVRSIVPIHMTAGHGRVFAVTLVSRDAQGAFHASLGLAAAPCEGGDLALLSPPVPLGGADAEIQYVYRVPLATGGPLTEVLVDVGDKAISRGTRAKITHKSLVVGAASGEITVVAPKGASIGVVGAIDSLDAEPPPAPGTKVRLHDRHMIGSGWYRTAGGAAYLLVHQVVPEVSDLCAEKNAVLPHAPPMLRLLARIDAKGFTTDPARVGVAYAIGIHENQPAANVYADPEKTCRGGPTSSENRFFQRGAGAQWLWGLFDSAAEAQARAKALGYATGTLLSTEPPAASPTSAAKEPWIVPAAKKVTRLGTFDCGFL
jgi:hypothetical protein